MTPADIIRRLVDVLRRSDPDYVQSHGCEPTPDHEWDAALQVAEDWLEEHGRDER